MHTLYIHKYPRYIQFIYTYYTYLYVHMYNTQYTCWSEFVYQQTCVYVSTVRMSFLLLPGWCGVARLCLTARSPQMMPRTASYCDGLGLSRGWVIGTWGCPSHMSPTPPHWVLAVGGANRKNKNYHSITYICTYVRMYTYIHMYVYMKSSNKMYLRICTYVYTCGVQTLTVCVNVLRMLMYYVCLYLVMHDDFYISRCMSRANIHHIHACAHNIQVL